MEKLKLIFGSRGSQLALAQTQQCIHALQQMHPPLECTIKIISTEGDRVQNVPLSSMSTQGVFVREIEQALRRGEIDLAVHSFKDLPTEQPEGLHIAAIPLRQDPRDVLYSRGGAALDSLPPFCCIGTSSTRRRAQVKALRQDAVVRDIRGNVDTRMRKVDSGTYDATILAAAGLARLGLSARKVQFFPLDTFLPAPAQGALAIEVLAENRPALQLAQSLDHAPSRTAATAERAVLQALGSGCSLPLAAHATVQGQQLHLRALVISPDGTERAFAEASGHSGDACVLGREVANLLKRRGAVRILENLADYELIS